MLRGYLLWSLLMSIVTFIFYGLDKFYAKTGRWRIADKTLYFCALLSGALGALLGMRCFRHKTKRSDFWFINGLALLLQIGVICYFLYKKWY